CPRPGIAPPQEPARADPPPHPDADDLNAIIDDPNASLGPQGLAPDASRSAPPHPDGDDRDAIIDDPNASLGPQGLAPDESGALPPSAHRLVREAAAELARAREAAGRCDLAALDASISRLDLLWVDATANSDWRGTTWQ